MRSELDSSGSDRDGDQEQEPDDMILIPAGITRVNRHQCWFVPVLLDVWDVVSNARMAGWLVGWSISC